jgi:hypothetical protein
MKSRIRGRDAAWAAVHMAERRPVPLQATDVVGPHLPVAVEGHRKGLPRVRKPSSSHDMIHAPTSNTDAHRAELREAFGATVSDQFVEVMMGKLISGLRPNPFDVLEEATLNARCRMHGGADGSGAPAGARNGNFRHGRYTKEVAAARRWIREAVELLRKNR